MKIARLCTENHQQDNQLIDDYFMMKTIVIDRYHYKIHTELFFSLKIKDRCNVSDA